jgi:nucleoside-diphosphate-sugar epimerase
MLKEVIRFDRLVRILADLVMLNFSLLLSDLIDKVVFSSGISGFENMMANLHYHILGVMLLDLIAVVIFFSNGFYTRSRSYQSRFKALVVFQAVSVTYLVFALCNYLVHNDFIAPFTLVMSWGISLVFLIIARLWSVIWRKILLSEVSVHAKIEVNEKEVLVIGGSGYIGSALLPLLLGAGYTVRVLDSFIYGREAIEVYLNHPKVKIIEADFRQIDKVVMAVKGVDAVIHLGAIVGDPACALDEALTIDINLMATRMIAEVCKGFGVSRFIFASTCSVYGASDDLLDEHSKLSPVSLYAKTKIACERLLHEMADECFSPVILRFSTIFGLSGRTRFDLVVNLLTAKACFDQHITVTGGDQWRPFLHVEDAARSVLAVLKAPKIVVNNQVFNVGSNSLNYTLMDVGQIIFSKVPEAKLEDLGTTQDRRNYRVSFNKINKALGFETKWSLEAGIEQVIRAIRSGEVTDYHDPRFNNAKFLQEKGAKDILRSMSLFDSDQILQV